MKRLDELRIEVIESQPFAENTYVIWNPPDRKAIIVDPGFDTRSILELIEEESLEPIAILNTHGHADHIAGNRVTKQAFPEAPIVIGAGEAELLVDPELNLSAPFGMPVTSPPADRLVREGERLELIGLAFEILEIPGHSPGSVVFACLETAPPFVLGGDVIFRGSVGRTDFPGGSMRVLVEGIHGKLFTLPDATVILSGHGEPTTIREEKEYNPFVGRNSGRRGPA
ncbi:MAG: MBL fold metallo-hydrolase [Isosphaeraceae bacterium]|nr:MBL fold metallo-hydrolase [Isosphaeraceae bacterium]